MKTNAEHLLALDCTAARIKYLLALLDLTRTIHFGMQGILMHSILRSILTSLALGVLWILLAQEAWAQRRVALVVGNSAYRHASVLANPRNDATDLGALLKRLGFEVIEGHDLDKASMDRKIRDFAERLIGSQLALFFYAGHGLQVGGQNYLVPVDAQLNSGAALDFETVRLDLVQRTMERESTSNIVIIDACRDNPLARNLARALGTRSTSIGKGLAAIESGEGTLISFSTQPGNVALDGKGRNSPFAAALLKHLPTPGDDLPMVLINVRNDVMAATERRQVPWEHSALTARIYFVPPKPSVPAPDKGDRTMDRQIELSFWESIKDAQSPALLQTYIDRYPNGEFATIARALIEHYERQEQAEEARRAEADKQREEEARKAAELKRLEEERRSKEEAGVTKRFKAKQREDKEAVKAAETADRAGKATIESKQAAVDTSDAARAASLPKAPPSTRAAGTFDGTWRIEISGGNCHGPVMRFPLTISAGEVTNQRRVRLGRVMPSGEVRWTGRSARDGVALTWEGTFKGNTGSGTFKRQDGLCAGRFIANRR